MEHRALTIERAAKWNKTNVEKRKQIVARNNKNSAIRKRLWHEQKTFDGNATLLEGKICRKCGSDYRVGIHHRDGNNGKRGKDMNNDPKNLIILCVRCHALVHGFGRFKAI